MKGLKRSAIQEFYASIAGIQVQRRQDAPPFGRVAPAAAGGAPMGAPYSAGLTARNVPGQVSYSTGSTDAFDPVVVLGGAYRLGPVVVALDKDLPGPVRLGAEYRARERFALRAGVRSEEGITFTAGLGLSFEGYQVQYAYEQPPVLDGTHRVSLGVTF